MMRKADLLHAAFPFLFWTLGVVGVVTGAYALLGTLSLGMAA